MSLRDLLKTRRRLTEERDFAWAELDRLRCLLEGGDSLETIRAAALTGKDLDPPRILPGSDIGEGRLIIQSWAVRVLAASLVDTINSTEFADNYLVMPFVDRHGNHIEVTIRRDGMMSPAEKATKLQRELDDLKKSL